MAPRDVERATTAGGLPVSPAPGPALGPSGIPVRSPPVDARVARIVGMVTRSDLLAAHRRRLAEAARAERSIPILRRAS